MNRRKRVGLAPERRAAAREAGRRSRARGPSLALLALALCLAAGFGAYLLDAIRTRPIPARADGIVVLTGGALRIETGLALLRIGVAERLLISGVGGGVGLPALLDANWYRRPSAPAFAGAREVLATADAAGPLITLGHSAATTTGNAIEIASWARANGLHSLVVVTAGYHMRRAMAEIATVLPHAALRPYPVHPPTSLRLFAVEYVKLLAVELGLEAPGRQTA